MTTTAVDTNVLLDILAANPRFVNASSRALLDARDHGALLISEVVYTELAAAFRGDVGQLREFLGDFGIRLARSNEAVLAEAGRSWRAYRDAGGPRDRVLPDFLIGAHASATADQLLSRDRGFYRRWFEGLKLVDPSRAEPAGTSPDEPIQ